jgi:propanol-preferring alcohol dehydrogenase
MKAMALTKIICLEESTTPLAAVDIPEPQLGAGELLVKVSVCGVCHTELDEIEGRCPPPRLPVIPGHQVVGRVVATGGGSRFRPGDRVGIAWIAGACGKCYLCRDGRENLCASFVALGRDVNGGYAEYLTVREQFAFPVPEFFSDVEAAPLLCAGAIGYRALKLTGLNGTGRLGLIGFGASAHLVLQMVRYRFPDVAIFVFVRNPAEREFALALGAAWAGDVVTVAPTQLTAIIDTTPAWGPVVHALKCLEPGGRLVINAIRKEEADRNALLGIEYPVHLWQEKEIKSVANITRADVAEFLPLAAEMRLRASVREYPLVEANQALMDLKRGGTRGAKVLRVA